MEIGLPDIYCDSAIVQLTAVDAVIQFSRRIPASQAPELVANARMSLEQAKVLTIVLRTALKEHERIAGYEIPVHPAVKKQLKKNEVEKW